MLELIACVVAGSFVGAISYDAVRHWYAHPIVSAIVGAIGGVCGWVIGMALGGDTWLIAAPVSVFIILMLPVITGRMLN